MEHWKRFALPVALGIAAGIMNMKAISAKITPEEFVAVNRSCSAGDTFAPEDLVKIEISGDLKSLRQTAVPWTQRANLYYRVVPRDLVQGDLLLWRDATALLEELPRDGEDRLPITLSSIPSVPSLILVGQHVGFWIGRVDDDQRPSRPEDEATGEYVGPFRVLAVGSRATPGRENASSGDSMEQVLTLAVRLHPKTKELDEKTRRLVAASNRQGGLQILAILLRGSDRHDGNPSPISRSTKPATEAVEAAPDEAPANPADEV